MKENSLISFVAGAAVGAALGVLFAPERGEVTRRRIKAAAKDGCDMAKDTYASAARKAAAVKGDIEELREVLREEGEEIRDSVRSRISERLDRLEKALVEAMEEAGEDESDEGFEEFGAEEADDDEPADEKPGKVGKSTGAADGLNGTETPVGDAAGQDAEGDSDGKDGAEENKGGRKIEIA